MHVKRTNIALVGLGLAALASCGPEAHGEPDQPEWLIGTFSTVAPGISDINVNSVGHYEFREDGTLTVAGVSGCRTPAPIEPVIKQWEVDGGVVRVDDPEPGTVFDAWVLRQGETCGVVYVDRVEGEQQKEFTQWARGRVCLRELPPCPQGTSCASCQTVLCDGEPVECE
jgi:hypothetical protein